MILESPSLTDPRKGNHNFSTCRFGSC